MSSPFPGMDPYLEGYLWPDFHHAFTSQIRRELAPVLPPQYVARIEVAIIIDTMPDSEIGIIYPDIGIVTKTLREPAPTLSSAPESTLKAPLTIPINEFEARIRTIELRDTDNNDLVTSIEILSPANKRGRNRIFP